jgi:hypothetical protein
MPSIKAYEIVLEIDGQESCITLDDTFPAIDSWASACSMAVLMAKHIHPDKEVELMAKHIHPDKEVEFVSCAEYEADEYADIGYVYDAPVVLQ